MCRRDRRVMYCRCRRAILEEKIEAEIIRWEETSLGNSDHYRFEVGRD